MKILSAWITTMCVFFGSNSEIIIVNPVLTNKGIWKPWTKCSSNKFLTAVDVSSHFNTTPEQDDSHGLINIVLQCNTLPNVPTSDSEFISTAVGGVNVVIIDPDEKKEALFRHPIHFKPSKDAKINLEYTLPLKTSCTNGIMTGIQLNSQKDQGTADDTGLNNIRIFCSTLNGNKPNYVEAYGNYAGEWTNSAHCPPRTAICGIQIQAMDLDVEQDDNIGIENLKFLCCQVENPGTLCVPAAEWELIHSTMKNKDPNLPPCSFTPSVGLGVKSNLDMSGNFELNLFTSLGYSHGTGQNIQSALFQNIKSNLEVSFDYNWASSNERNWRKLGLDATITFQCAGNSDPTFRVVKLYQLVATCSYHVVRSTRFRKVDVTENEAGQVKETEIEFGA